MRGILALSAIIVAAAIVSATAVRADTPEWYLTFQKQACQQMPSQAGCFGFERSGTVSGHSFESSKGQVQKERSR